MNRILIVLGLAVFSSHLFALGTQEPSMTVVIEPNKTYQTMEHFGASAAWWAQAVGTWPEETRSTMLDRLFDRKKGIGLNLIRYNIGGGKEGTDIADPWRSAESPLDGQGNLDWSRDAAAVRVIDGAVARGAGVILFTNSPPAAMTVTGRTTGNRKETNLRPDQREAFAKFLADCAVSLAAERRWPLVAVSPMNEPQWDWQPSKGQEGSYYDPDDAVAILKAVTAEFRRRNLTTPISAIESGEWKLLNNVKYLKIWDDPELRGALNHYAVHSYWSDAEDKAALFQLVTARYPGLKFWQTEWTEMKAGKDTGMDSALVLARTVHDDLVEGQASSWQYWIAVSKYDYRDGLLYANETNQSFEATKRLWALGNWSRFLFPGARRVGVTASGATLSASAFQNPDGSLVCVLINTGETALTRVSLQLPFEGGSMTVAETSEFRDLETVYTGPRKSLTLAARSVATVVVRR